MCEKRFQSRLGFGGRKLSELRQLGWWDFVYLSTAPSTATHRRRIIVVTSSSSSSLSSSPCYGGPVRETRDGCIEKGDFSTLVVAFFSTFVSSRVILSIRACKRAVAVSGNSLAELVPPCRRCLSATPWRRGMPPKLQGKRHALCV